MGVLGKSLDMIQIASQNFIFLGRTITLTEDGIVWEGVKKHVPAFLNNLQGDFSEALGEKRSWSGARTPGTKLAHVPERVLFNATKVKAYRGLAALGNIMAQDRPDIGSASKRSARP